jgi:ribose 5-phosphate isomerase B
LTRRGIEVLDFGTAGTQSVDYPDYARLACEAVAAGQAEKAVLACGSGVGICIAANKVKGIRCALCLDEMSAEMSRLHNDANAIALRGREFDPERAARILGIWLDTPFSGDERHQRRIDKIRTMEA